MAAIRETSGKYARFAYCMQVRRKVSLSQVRVRDRIPLNKRTLALVDHLRVGGSVPPLHVMSDGFGQFTVLDGRHRWLAFKLLEVTHAWVRYGQQ